MTQPQPLASEPVVVTVRATRTAIWGLLEDPVALQRVLPGCESLRSIGPGRYSAVLATKAGFVTIRADAIVELGEADPPNHVRLAIDGRPRAFGGSFRAVVPLDLDEVDATTTRITYRLEVSLSGGIAAFGGRTLRDALNHQVGDLVRNVEKELRDHPRP